MTRSSPRPRVLMIVLDELIHTTRVLRSAESLAAEHDVLLIGVLRHKFTFDQASESRGRPFRMEWVDLGYTARLPRNAVGYAARYGRACWGLWRRGVAFKPDFVHAHELPSLPIGRAIQKATGAKLIYDAHELYRDTVHGSAWYWHYLARIETRLMAACDGIIACNEDRARIMRDEYGAPFLPNVVPNIPAGRDHVPSTLLRDVLGERAAGLDCLVLYQGAIMAGRGLQVLPRALLDLPPATGIVIVGGGDAQLKQELAATAAELGVADRFFLLPPVPHAELFGYTCAADVGILIYENTCRNNYYCAPNKLYEYAAAGLPMVGSDLPPIRSFLAENDVGVVFSTEDASSLARAITQVSGERETHERLRRNCLRAGRRFTWEASCKGELIALYSTLAKDGTVD